MRTKLAVILGSAFFFFGCQTLEQRLAGKVGCDPKTVKVTKKINAPAYQQYNFECDGKNYVCKHFPVYQDCNEVTDKK